MARGPIFISEVLLERTTPTCLHTAQAELFAIWSSIEKVCQPLSRRQLWPSVLFRGGGEAGGCSSVSGEYDPGDKQVLGLLQSFAWAWPLLALRQVHTNRCKSSLLRLSAG